MKKMVVVLLIVSLAGFAFAAGQGEGARTESVSFLTSGQGGTFYVAGTGIASLTSRQVDNLSVNAEVTRGVVENARLMASGESSMGFSYGSIAYNISRGLSEFENAQWDGMRAVALIHNGALNIVTRARTGIDSVEGLRGRRVSIGPAGSGSAAVAEEFLRSVDMWDAVNRSELSFGDSASALRDGNIDAFFIGGATPVPVLIELEASIDMRLIPVDQESTRRFLEKHPYHVAYTIQPGMGYQSVTDPLNTVGYTVIWATRDDVPEWVIYEMLKAMFSEEGRAYLRDVQLAFREMEPGQEHFRSIDLPYHPGAERFYREQGLID